MLESSSLSVGLCQSSELSAFASHLIHLVAGVLPDANVVSSVPMMLEAFCLHEKGRALITEHAPLRALVPLLSHRAYCTPDPAGVSPLQLPDFSSGLEELVRHMPHALCYQAVDAVLAALRVRSPRQHLLVSAEPCCTPVQVCEEKNSMCYGIIWHTLIPPQHCCVQSICMCPATWTVSCQR